MDLSKIIGLIASILGIITGCYFIWRWYIHWLPRKISWRRITAGVLNIIKKMEHDNFIPDLIIGIGRSGAILGGLLAGNMGNLSLALIDRKFRWDKRAREYIQSNFTSVTIGKNCKKILIVIGEIYTGQTMKEVCERLGSQLKNKEYRTATLVQKRGALFQSYYHVFIVSKTKKPAWCITEKYTRFERAEVQK